MFEPQAQTRGASSSSALPISRNSAGSFTTAPEAHQQSNNSSVAPGTKLSESTSRYLAPTIPEQSAASQENLLEAVNDAAALHSKLSSTSPSMGKPAPLPDASSPMLRSSSQASGLAPQDPHARHRNVGSNNISTLSQSMSSPSVMLPSLPGDGLMSGPYPMLQPISTLEPLQTATAMPGAPTVAPTSPDQLSPTGYPDPPAMAVPLQSSSSPFQPQQNRFSQTSPTSPNLNNNNMSSLAGTPAARLSSSPEATGMLPASSYMNTQMRGPFPPVGGYYTPQMPNSNSRNDLAAAAAGVPLRKPEPEICIECMMRDREMADVDVTTPGVWSRSSDVDFYEALAAEDEEDRQLAAAAANNGDSSVEGVGTSRQHHHLGRSPQSPAAGSASFFNAQGSEESGYAASASGASVDRARNSKLQHGSRKKRVGRGEALLAPSLKTWNSMVAPVSNYRWKSLQAYLSDQCQYLNPQALAEERERYAALRAQWAETSLSDLERGAAARPVDSAARSPSRLRTRSTAFDLAEDEAQPGRRRSRVAEAAQSRNGRPRTSVDENKPSTSASVYQNPGLAASNSSMPPTLQSQPRRYSSPLLDLPTTNALPQPASPNLARNDGLLASPKSFDAGISRSYFPTARAASPSAWSERPRSIWSNFGGRFRKGNGSSTSLAISGGSMLDMHLGLSVDRHVPQTPASRYDAQQQYMHHHSAAEEEQMAYEEEVEGQSKRKKKGLKKFLSRIFDGNSAASSSTAAPSTNPARNSRGRSQTQGGSNPPLDLSYLSGDSNEPLEPPVPSYLAGSGGPGVRHDRSASSSSQSSLPHSPKDVFPSPAFRRPTSYYFDQQPSSPADSSHVLAATQNMHESSNHKGSVHIPSAINEKSLPVPSSLPPAAGSTADLSPAAAARHSQELRRQKSLPALPTGESESPEDVVSELPMARPSSQPPNMVHQYPQSTRPDLYSLDASRSTHGFDDDSSSMRKSKSKTKLFSLPFRKHKEPKSSSDDRS